MFSSEAVHSRAQCVSPPSAKRPRDSDDSDNDGMLSDGNDEGPPPSPIRRSGVRASFYRKSPPKAKSSESALASNPHSPARALSNRSPLEVLLSASEEGDYDTVVDCLRAPGADILINLRGFARGVVTEYDANDAPVEWGHPEALTCYVDGDYALGYAAFHGHVRIVRALLEAGALPGLRNSDAKSALALAELGTSLSTKKQQRKLAPADVPRVTASAERAEVVRMLKLAVMQQTIVENASATLDGRIAQVVSVGVDGMRLVIINDAAPSPGKPFYEKSAVTSAFLLPSQLLTIRPPPPPAKAWPLEMRFEADHEARAPVTMSFAAVATAAPSVAEASCAASAEKKDVDPPGTVAAADRRRGASSAAPLEVADAADGPEEAVLLTAA